MAKKKLQRSPQEWISSLPVFFLLLMVMLSGNSEKMHAQLLKAGEFLWHDYFILRGDFPPPDCNIAPDIEAELNKLAAETDDLDALFDEQPFDRQAARISLLKAKQLCVEKHQLAKQNRQRVTLSVSVFRSLETSVEAISLFTLEKQRFILLLVLFICAITSTVRQQHIAFKPVITRRDHQVSWAAQLLGNVILTISAWNYWHSAYSSSAVIEHPEIYQGLMLGFSSLGLVSLVQFFNVPPGLKPGGKIRQALFAVPLYIFMAFGAGGYFFLSESHAAGLAIFFSLLFDQAGLFLNIGLYIWVGMLLKQTVLGELVFNVFKPWRMSPELLAFVAIVVMAVPTAYTGASGIIIIAMGSIVYRELRRVGARRQLALAATAMTGSAGVVLRPCLLVVLIAALNKEVVTDQLYSWGVKTFIVSILVFFCFVYMTKREKISLAPGREALKPFLQALKPLLPYVLIIGSLLIVYAVILNAKLDEFSAPVILPMLILALIVYEKLFSGNSPVTVSKHNQAKLELSIRTATSEASVHIGALLVLMGLSFVLGGVIERCGLLDVLPNNFSSIWTTLVFLLVTLVAIGMIMDPFGAVVLVTGSIAQIAYQNGVNPVHFWMMTLVAFELGYLTPPVTLNHLLTKQMVGHQEVAKATLEGENFWYRHERILLPLATLATTLLLVSIVPVLVGVSGA